MDPARARVPGRRDHQYPPYLRIIASGKDHVHIMTNRVRIALKALQPLGNSIRSLDWARCTYLRSARMILRPGGPLKDLRTAPNTAIRDRHHPPTEPLHQLMGILPIDLRLQLLIKNASHACTASPQIPNWRQGPQAHGENADRLA